MLIKGYSFYFFNALSATWLGWPGILSMLCLAGALLVFFSFKSNRLLRSRLASGLLVLSVGLFTLGFYTAIYNVKQEGDFLHIAKEFPDDQDCGAAWTSWHPAGAGLLNPCKKGCYRGTTFQQQTTMVHFPPWPLTRREIQCWVRTPPAVASVLDYREEETAP